MKNIIIFTLLVVVGLLFGALCVMVPDNTRLSYELREAHEAVRVNADHISALADRLIRAEESMAAFEIIGRASWYGNIEHGRTTSNGETFDRNALTMAVAWPLPLNRWYRVTAENGASIRVWANDRIPLRHQRVADLSEAAAAQIGMISEGVVTVSMRPGT